MSCVATTHYLKTKTKLKKTQALYSISLNENKKTRNEKKTHVKKIKTKQKWNVAQTGAKAIGNAVLGDVPGVFTSIASGFWNSRDNRNAVETEQEAWAELNDCIRSLENREEDMSFCC